MLTETLCGAVSGTFRNFPLTEVGWVDQWIQLIASPETIHTHPLEYYIWTYCSHPQDVGDTPTRVLHMSLLYSPTRILHMSLLYPQGVRDTPTRVLHMSLLYSPTGCGRHTHQSTTYELTVPTGCGRHTHQSTAHAPIVLTHRGVGNSNAVVGQNLCRLLHSDSITLWFYQ